MLMLWLTGGALIGLFNALTMNLTVGRLGAEAPARSLGRVVASMAVRSILAAAWFAAAFWNGFTAGLLALTGFWVARWAAILWWHCKG